MFHSKLRAAIAQTFPDRYTWLRWPKLLPDFVNVQLKDYLINRDRYEQGQTTVDPVITPELREAATLLAKQEDHSYAFLALTHYLLQWEVAAARREADHYRQQAEGYEQVMLGYQRLSDHAIDAITNIENPTNRIN